MLQYYRLQEHQRTAQPSCPNYSHSAANPQKNHFSFQDAVKWCKDGLRVNVANFLVQSQRSGKFTEWNTPVHDILKTRDQIISLLMDIRNSFSTFSSPGMPARFHASDPAYDRGIYTLALKSLPYVRMANLWGSQSEVTSEFQTFVRETLQSAMSSEVNELKNTNKSKGLSF